MKNVVVVGQGFVGAIMALAIASSKKQTFKVVGLEKATPSGHRIVNHLNSGNLPFDSADESLTNTLHSVLLEKRYHATVDPHFLRSADIVVIDINLDVDKSHRTLSDYKVELEPFQQAIDMIGKEIKQDCLILVETTVPPGTCINVVKPILVKNFVDRGMDPGSIKLAHSYERVMPGENYLDSIINMPRVFSGVDKISSDCARNFLELILNTEEFPLVELENTTASEISKCLENSYRAMNISFMIEWSRLAEAAKVNISSIVRAIRQRPTHNNIMLPGIGVGGYCLTKDPMLADWSAKKFFGLEDGLFTSLNAVDMNDNMPSHALEFVLKHSSYRINGSSVLLLGVAYKGEVSDTRYTPVQKFYELLVELKCKVLLHDPYVKFWMEKKIDVPRRLDFEKIKASKVKIGIISTMHKRYDTMEFCDEIISTGVMELFDLNGTMSTNSVKYLQRHGIKVLLLGNGGEL